MKNLWLHYTVLLIHVGAALFWLGWMVFIFFLLNPALKETVPDRAEEILSALKSRIRDVVFWLIFVIFGTGLYNVYFNNLHQPDRLLNTDYGQRFLVKFTAVMVLFSVYALAPYLTGANREGESTPSEERTTIVLHVVAFSAGILAAFLGFTL